MVAGVTGVATALALGITPGGHAGVVVGLALILLVASRPASQLSGAPTKNETSAPTKKATALYRLAGVSFVCLFLEGAMADWAGLLAATFGAGPASAPLAYAAFTATWAGGRFLGDRLTSAIGDSAIVRAGGFWRP